MSLKTALSSFIDNTGLAETFARKPQDAAKARKRLLRGIETARRQFREAPASTRAPSRWWKLNNGVVALTVKVKGDTLALNGAPTNYLSADKFEAFLDQFAQAVAAGEFDAELANHGRGDAKVTLPTDSALAGGHTTPAASRRGTISREAAKVRGIKAAASRARNRAARDAGPAQAEPGWLTEATDRRVGTTQIS